MSATARAVSPTRSRPEGSETTSNTTLYLLGDQIDPVGLIRRFENCIKQVPAVLAAEEEQLAKARADLPRLERQLTATAFARADRLQTVKLRIAGIEKALQPSEPEHAVRTADVPPQADAHLLHDTQESQNAVENSARMAPGQDPRIARLEAEFAESQARRTGRGR